MGVSPQPDEVAIKGPDGIDASLTPRAALQSAERLEAAARVTDLHVWRVGPGAHAAIVSCVGEVTADEVRRRLKPVHELSHVTVEIHAGAAVGA